LIDNDECYGNDRKISCLSKTIMEYSCKITFFALPKVVLQYSVGEADIFIFYKKKY